MDVAEYNLAIKRAKKKIYNARWREANTEKSRAARRVWQSKNVEKERAYNRLHSSKTYYTRKALLSDPDEYAKSFYKRPNIRDFKGEALISKNLTDTLDILRIAGKVNGLYTHIAHESLATAAYNLKQKAMGKIAGVPDWAFFWKDKALLIELKTPKGHLSSSQKFFHSEAKKYGCNIHVARSVEQALDILYENGFLKK